MKLVLLPGMDGTGALFEPFLRSLPSWIEPQVIRYPLDRRLSPEELCKYIESALPSTEPFAMLAESFSTPLAIRIAARNQRLVALVICAGFVTPPVRGVVQVAGRFLAGSMFRISLPALAIRKFLTGADASKELVNAVRCAIKNVEPNVLAERVRFVLECDERHALRTISVPVLYVQASRDRLVRQDSVDRIRELKPDISLLSIDGPHLILQARSEEAGKGISECLAAHFDAIV